MKGAYISPSVTIFERDGMVDLEAMKAHFDFLIDGGVDGILLLGSIGEFYAMGIDEKKRLITCATEHIAGRVKLIVGTASMIKSDIVDLSRFAHEAGADASIILPPYYFALGGETIEAYYGTLAEELHDQTLWLYNFPDRTGYCIPIDTACSLIERYENIRGFKDTQAGMAYTIELIKRIKPKRPDFKIYSGFDDNFAHNILSGGDGCIAGLSNAFPALCHAWVQAFVDEDMQKASEIQQTVNGLMEIYQVGIPFIPYIKAVLRLMGHDMGAGSGFPLQNTKPEEDEKLAAIVRKYMNV